MCAVLVIITDVLAHQPLQMPLVQYDHMIEEILAAVTDPALCNAIGLGRQLQRTATLPIPTSR
jgi:hypothetical protein